MRELIRDGAPHLEYGCQTWEQIIIIFWENKVGSTHVCLVAEGGVNKGTPGQGLLNGLLKDE